MKTSSLFLSFFLLFIIGKPAHAQLIPNADFEDWEESPNFSYNPVGWTTDNGQVTPSIVVPDSAAFSNEFAMKVIAQPSELGMDGEAYTVVPVFNQYDQQLNFYAKWQKSSGSVFVEVTFFTGNQSPVYTASWYPTTDSSDWALVSIDLLAILPEPPPINEIKIRVAAQVGDFSPGMAWISVDAMEFSNPTGLKEVATTKTIEIYPNPCEKELIIQPNAKFNNRIYKIINLQGKLVEQGKINHAISTESLPSGHYILLVMDENETFQKKFTKL